MSAGTESPLTRTSASSGSAARTRVTTTARGERGARAGVWAVEAGRALGDRIRGIAERAGGAVMPAGWLVLTSATLGLGLGAVFGWVEWLVAGIASVVISLTRRSVSPSDVFATRKLDSARIACARASGDI